MALYNGEELPAVRLHYKDYAEWQQGVVHQEYLAHQREFWIREFSESAIVLDLPTDFSRPAVKGYAGDSRSFVLNLQETDKLRRLGKQQDATIFMTLLSILNILLSKLSNQNDVTI